jgi:Flp pilus assembly protein protease CpaA
MGVARDPRGKSRKCVAVQVVALVGVVLFNGGFWGALHDHWSDTSEIVLVAVGSAVLGGALIACGLLWRRDNARHDLGL